MFDSLADVRVPVIFLLACLFPIVVVCAILLVWRHFSENWLQWFGLGGLIFYSLGRIDRSIDKIAKLVPDQWSVGDWFDAAWLVDVGAYQMIGVGSLTLYLVGTLWKVWHHRNSPRNPNGTGKAHP